MEPVMFIVSTISGLIFTKTSKEVKGNWSQRVTQAASQIVGYICEKFRLANVEKMLTTTLDDKLEVNRMAFIAVLEAQMGNDEFFAGQLRDLIEQFESFKASDQEMLIDIEVEEDIKTSREGH